MLWSMGLGLSPRHRCKSLQARSSTSINYHSLPESCCLASPFEEVGDIQRHRHTPCSGQVGLVFRSENSKLSSTHILLVTLPGIG